MTDTFRRTAAPAALLAAAGSVVFTVTFALYVRESYRWALWASTITRIVTGLLLVVVFVALQAFVRDREPDLGRVAAGIGVVGALASVLHAAYDLADLAKPQHVTSDLPSQVDPRGFATFALVGLAMLLFAWFARRVDALPSWTTIAGLAAGALLVILWLGRMIALDPNDDVIRVAALASGLVAVPAFEVGLAGRLRNAT
jgi:drug/metabolite transporter (DMT)-like permease